MKWLVLRLRMSLEVVRRSVQSVVNIRRGYLIVGEDSRLEEQ
jgi:hypothetical protein